MLITAITDHEADEKAESREKMPDVVTIIEIEQQAFFIVLSRHCW